MNFYTMAPNFTDVKLDIERIMKCSRLGFTLNLKSHNYFIISDPLAFQFLF